MAPDIVDAIQARRGHRPQTVFFGALILALKVGMALCASMFGGLLYLVGYAPMTFRPTPCG